MIDRLTDDDLKTLRQIADEAAPDGFQDEWKVHEREEQKQDDDCDDWPDTRTYLSIISVRDHPQLRSPVQVTYQWDGVYGVQHDIDERHARYIAAFDPAMARRLIGEVERLRSECDRYREALEAVQGEATREGVKAGERLFEIEETCRIALEATDE